MIANNPVWDAAIARIRDSESPIQLDAAILHAQGVAMNLADADATEGQWAFDYIEATAKTVRLALIRRVAA